MCEIGLHGGIVSEGHFAGSLVASQEKAGEQIPTCPANSQKEEVRREKSI
jgi:hypothetical protein